MVRHPRRFTIMVKINATGFSSIALLCGVAVSFAGCSATPKSKPVSWTAPASQPAANAHAAGGPSSSTTTGASRDSGVSFTDDPNAATPARRTHAPGLIGVFGELVSDSADSAGQYDGAGSIGRITDATDGACFDPEIDRTGQWLAFASTMHRPTSDLYIKQVGSRTVTQLTTDPADDLMPAFSPDSKKVAFCSNRAGNWDVYVMDVGGGQATQVTSDLLQELHPTWSPDGRELAYCVFGDQSQRWEIWTVSLDNPSTRRFLDYGLFPQWCPDIARHKILFQRARQRGSRFHSVWTIDVADGHASNPTEIVAAANAAAINPSWSPDGSKIVFVTVLEPDETPGSRPHQSDVWIVDIDGSNRTALTNGEFANFQPVWAGDGRVYFVSDRNGVDNIWAVAASRPGRMPDMTTNLATGNDPGSEHDGHH
jgi:TolB protein